jgi:N-hydroxyarylamine O-acetyltransferase
VSAFQFDRETYLQRICLNGDFPPTADALTALHHAQLYTIPFENFDIQLGRGIDLNPAVLFDKLVHRKRGGYCFELNGLFLMALNHFGFDARPLLARVHITGTPTGRGHQIALLTIAGRRWIADVGFGSETPRAPVPLELNRPAVAEGQSIRLVDGGDFGFILQSEKDGRWMDLYSFTLDHVFPPDIKYGNHYTSTHPESLFVQARVAALPIENGVVTLFNNTLKTTIDGKEIVTELADGPEYLDALRSHFGIALDAPYESLRHLS